MNRVPTPHTRALARAWYARNKDRLRQKKIDACHRYRARKAIGGVINPEPEPKAEAEAEAEAQRTIQRGKFFVSF